MTPTITHLKPRRPPSTAHHVGNPPTAFKNPWPSASSTHSLVSAFRTRFFSPHRNFVPVPLTRDELVPIRAPTWGANQPGLKATWIGHASFLVETTKRDGKTRGIRILIDPVWSDRMGPWNLIGPTRFSPPPCKLDEVPDVDLVLLSHNHYDHMDAPTIKALYARARPLKFLCALGNAKYLKGMGVQDDDIVELDWWGSAEVEVEDVGAVKLTCTPSQHASARSGWDAGSALWCSWVVEEVEVQSAPKKLFFAGDTGYRTIDTEDKSADLSSYPVCPAFAEIGETYGPFDLALLPIGCYLPRTFMSFVHCAPEDSICIHKDIRSKKSLGMHYGTVRGGISAHFEDVREPPLRWKAACEKAGLGWGEEICVCDLGDTVVV